MSPEVTQRKVDQIRRYLTDLERYRGLSREEFNREHYAVERLVELLVEAASSTAFHALSIIEGTSPGSYREAFHRLGELGLIDSDLARRLGMIAGMRNILVHRYQSINLDVVFASIDPCACDMAAFTEAVLQIDLQRSNAVPSPGEVTGGD